VQITPLEYITKYLRLEETKMITEIIPANPFITSKHSSLEKAMEEAKSYRE